MTLLFVTVAHCGMADAQSKRGNEWITGGGGGRVKFANGNVSTSGTPPTWSYFTGGNSCIADTNGILYLPATA
ncbi:MAG: hypothetical protein HWD58_09615 [Bacteroidota bacterium]|nr:MAG: hypothetical protein HWD58_09615 [Bacteroidota bacterium]